MLFRVFFVYSFYVSVLRNEFSFRRLSSFIMLDGVGVLGKFDFEIVDFFFFGCLLGLVLVLRKIVIFVLDGEYFVGVG